MCEPVYATLYISFKNFLCDGKNSWKVQKLVKYISQALFHLIGPFVTAICLIIPIHNLQIIGYFNINKLKPHVFRMKIWQFDNFLLFMIHVLVPVSDWLPILLTWDFYRDLQFFDNFQFSFYRIDSLYNHNLHNLQYRFLKNHSSLRPNSDVVTWTFKIQKLSMFYDFAVNSILSTSKLLTLISIFLCASQTRTKNEIIWNRIL